MPAAVGTGGTPPINLGDLCASTIACTTSPMSAAAQINVGGNLQQLQPLVPHAAATAAGTAYSISAAGGLIGGGQAVNHHGHLLQQSQSVSGGLAINGVVGGGGIAAGGNNASGGLIGLQGGVNGLVGNISGVGNGNSSTHKYPGTPPDTPPGSSPSPPYHNLTVPTGTAAGLTSAAIIAQSSTINVDVSDLFWKNYQVNSKYTIYLLK